MSFLVFFGHHLFALACRPIFLYFLKTWELMAKQSTRHDIFSRGHVVAWGLDLGISPSELHGKNCNPHILETLSQKEHKFEQTTLYGRDNKYAHQQDSSYEI